MKPFILFLSMTLSTIMLSGCWDRSELEEFAFPVVIGLDKGEDDLIKVTLQTANAIEGSPKAASSKGQKPSEIITLSAPDIITTRDLANITVTKEVQYSHAKTLVISEEFARSPQFKDTIESTLRDRQIRRDLNIIVSKESAADFIRANKPKLERRPHKFYSRWEKTGLMPEATLNRYFETMDAHQGLFLAIYATATKFDPKVENDDEYRAGEVDKRGGNPTQMLGSAIFKDNQMIGTLSGEQTRQALLLRPETRVDTMIASFKDPIRQDKHISVRLIKNSDTKVVVKQAMENKVTSIHASIPVEIQILHIPSRVDYVTDRDNLRKLEQSIENELNSDAMSLVSKTQLDYKDEPFLWSKNIRGHFATWDAYEKYNWGKTYPKSSIKVTYKAHITQFGKELAPK